MLRPDRDLVQHERCAVPLTACVDVRRNEQNEDALITDAETEASPTVDPLAAAAPAPAPVAEAGAPETHFSDPTATAALAVLEGGFKENTREHNVAQLQAESYYLCEPDGSVISIITTDLDGDKQFIHALVVSANHRDKGVGKFMVHHLAKQLTCDEVYVQSDDTAVEFYDKCGFAVADGEEGRVALESEEHCTAMVADRSKLLSLTAPQPSTTRIKLHTFDDAAIQTLPPAEENEGVAGMDSDEDGADAASAQVMDADDEDDETASDDPTECDVTGPMTEESENFTGNGGCTAHALYELGVFDSPESAKHKLNDQGKQLLEKHRKEVRSDYERSRVYTEDDRWSHEVIKRAVAAAGFDIKKLDLDSDEVTLKRDFKRGKYLLDGVQNQDHTRQYSGIYVNGPPGYTPGPAEAPMQWRHAIAIENSRVLEQNADTFSIKWLWLQENNRPDMEKGYMREVLKVYHITPKPESSDKEEEPVDRATKRPRI